MSSGESAASKNEYFNRHLEQEGEDDYIDRWNTGELLFLTSCVTRGDRNWVSVARVIKPYIGDYLRPPDWSTPKNCAFQYQRLLSELEEDSKKKTVPRVERETSEVTLVRTLTEKRSNELKWLTQQTKATANSLKTYIEMVESGDFDDNLDDIIKQLEEQEKQQEDSYNEYLARREKLIDSRKLNISRIKRGKVFSKASETKKKLSLSDPPESNPHHAVVEEVIKSIKKEMKCNEEFATPTKMSTPVKSDMSPLKMMMTPVKSEPSPMKMTSPIKSEMEAAPITLNALLDSKVTIPSSVAPTSPLLTSLLRSIASPSPVSHTLSASSLKEFSESLSEGQVTKMDVESPGKSPRSSVPPSPRPTPASSPLLNSLLKNSPSTPLQMSPVKEISPKAVSSPQPFFNPTSALATAAAQQLAVATSTIPLFQQHELADSRKISLSSSPVTSACLSAPTLSKLLEMPPSTPGRLPPLPVLDPPSTPTPVAAPAPTTTPTTPSPAASPLKPPNVLLLPELLKTPPPEEAKKAAVPVVSSSPEAALPEDVFAEVVAAEVAEISDAALASVFDEAQLENIDILEAVCESINQAFEEKVTKKEDPPHADLEKQKEQDDVIKNICPPKSSFTEASPDPVPLSIDVGDKLPLMSLTPKPKTSPSPLKSDQLLGATPFSVSDASKAGEVMEDDKGGPGKRFYKSRTGGKKEESPEKTPDASPLLQSPKKAVQAKTESKSPVDAIETPVVIEEPETKQLEAKAIKGSSETKSPPAKKPRLYENTPTEKPQELSEDEAVVRRSGRRGKKGRGRSAKSNLSKTDEPKDQYEFTESTEENSVGYQATNTLCYMPRLKEDSQADDPKSSAQESEETPNVAVAEKKLAIALRNKQGRQPSTQQASARKLFPSDEDRMSDSLTSDEASNHLLSEDKLKKWEETCEKKGDSAKGAGEGVKRTWKGIEISKKKIPPPKRASGGKPGRKDSKPSSVDMEDLSAGSRDSEEVSGTDKEISDEKDLNAATPMDLEVETNDSHPSSSVAAESDKQMEDVEGGESFQGSVTIDFSPPPDVKEAPHFGKQDWMHNSPKSSEPVSQSSEESEYESDNWDNQSVSTNKSASHSTGTQPRLKRKERETPEYKAWKKAISIVLREVSCHKNANVFLQKVTNDVAPGYLSIVHQPMDLSLIKKNIDNGVVKTTSEFHRDMLLMFQNAIMYNSSDHDVHQMAMEMQKDVIEQIGAFLITQHNSKNAASEPITNLRGARTAKAQKGVGKHSASSSKLKDDAD